MPPHVNFLTVPHELQAIAYACKQALVQSGYSLKYEYTEVHFPETATIYAKRGRREQHFYIFDARIKEDRLSLWAGYGRSCSSATFVVLCLPQNGAISTEAMVRVRELGVGLTAIGPDGNCVEILAPVDLSVNIQLPPLERHRAPIRRELAKVHAWFDRGDWKGGFEEACKLLEKSARDHLRREARAARVQVPGGGGAPRTLAARDIARMPLGALADVFCKKLIPSQIDAHLCTGLKRINPDRINVAHQITTQRTERKLRDNVGRHMWTIDNLLREIPA